MKDTHPMPLNLQKMLHGEQMKKTSFIHWSKRQKIFFSARWLKILGLALLGTLLIISVTYMTIKESEPLAQRLEKTITVVEQFIPIYTTYDANNLDKMFQEIQPLVTNELQKEIKKDITKIHPEKLLRSRYVIMEPLLVDTMDQKNEIYWRYLVTIEETKSNEKKVTAKYICHIYLVKEKDDWKISDVTLSYDDYLTPPPFMMHDLPIYE